MADIAKKLRDELSHWENMRDDIRQMLSVKILGTIPSKGFIVAAIPLK